ncbi:hypothetical protein [Bradyrhizobium sp. 149]|uniref:hypothetical protein n=1 Tax=Bradyrhizobium sp. 149 TaxID=2782624 RepID=UPI001FFB0C92|nr:hypothetical protein [Bradyrhizobium sp. 149]
MKKALKKIRTSRFNRPMSDSDGRTGGRRLVDHWIQRILKVACQPPEMEPSLTTSQIGRPPLPLPRSQQV